MAENPVAVKNTAHRDSFVLRIWREGKKRIWKGWIQHANSGESTPLRSLTDLIAFIEQHTNDTPSTSPRGKENRQEKTSGLR